MRRFAVLSAALLAALAIASAPATAEKTTGDKYVANMSGDQETPDKGDPDGKGRANVNIDNDRGEVCYTMTFEGIAPPDKAHIHRGAKGTAGDVVVNLPPDKSGKCVPGDKATLEQIRSNPGGFYVNLHNPEYPKGAIRGQLEPIR